MSEKKLFIFLNGTLQSSTPFALLLSELTILQVHQPPSPPEESKHQRLFIILKILRYTFLRTSTAGFL